MNLKKFTRIGVLLLSALSVVFLATIMGSDAPDGGMILPFILVSYIAVFVATGLVLYYSIKNLMASKNIKKTLDAATAITIGNPAPEFSAPSPEGTTISLKAHLRRLIPENHV